MEVHIPTHIGNTHLKQHTDHKVHTNDLLAHACMCTQAALRSYINLHSGMQVACGQHYALYRLIHYWCCRAWVKAITGGQKC